MVDRSRQGVFWLVRKTKIKNKMCLLAHVGGKKKNKRKIKGILLVFRHFYRFMFLAEKHMLAENIYVMSEDKKKAEW